MLEASYWKICEDYLGVPLIQAGDSVIIIIERPDRVNDIFIYHVSHVSGKQGGTANLFVPCYMEQIHMAWDFFCPKVYQDDENTFYICHLYGS